MYKGVQGYLQAASLVFCCLKQEVTDEVTKQVGQPKDRPVRTWSIVHRNLL